MSDAEAIRLKPSPTSSSYYLNRCRIHVRYILKLATPIILTRLGIHMMSLVDTIMVARHSTEELSFQALALALWLGAVELAAFYTADPVLRLETASLIAFAPILLMTDCLQLMLGYTLRGRKDILVPFILHLFFSIFFMLPFTYYLTFMRGWGLGLAASGALLCLAFTGRFLYLTSRDIRAKG